MHVLNGAIYGPTFSQSRSVYDRVLSCRQFSLQSISMMFLNVANFTVIRMYADDILLLAPTVTLLNRLFTTCEAELTYLNMAINSKKSCCLRVGSRCDRPCNNLCTSGGHVIPWVDEMRYLGLFIIRSHTFKCSLDHDKRSFYRAVNGIFGRLGKTASKEVISELLKSKCLPILLYGLEACPLNKTNLRSLDFSVNRFFMKLFNTSRHY